MNKIYSQFDLTNNQEKILSLILYSGIVDTTLITKKLGISRPNTYDVLNKLIEKGLITKFKQNNKTLYKANEIDLNKILQEKTQEIEDLKNDIIDFNQTLADTEDEEHYDIETFSGKKGFSNIIFNILNNKILYVFGAEGIFEKKYPYVFMKWINQIKEDSITINAIYNEKFKIIREKNDHKNIVSRYTERELSSKTTTVITENSISLIHWQEIPLVIHIKDKRIALDYKNEFLNLWKLTKE